MTHHSDDRSFEHTLDSAVQDMHENTPRGNRPPRRVWNRIAAEAGIPQQESADSSTEPSIHSDKQTQDASPRTRPTSTPQPVTHLGWTSWLAAALVLVLVGASVNFLLPEDNGGDTTSDDSIALAPGTPDLSILEPLNLASPPASPELFIPDYGPEYACHAEPLTEDQVFDIVMNPHREYERLGSSNSIAETENPEEVRTDFSYWQPFFQNPVDFSITTDPEETTPIIETGNKFWNCLMTGTAFQVWGMMHPYTVQHEILMQYPVLRDEDTLRNHIATWGPQRYSASIYHAFPDLGNTEPTTASRVVDETQGNIIVRYNVAEGMPVDVGEPFSAIVRVIPADPAASPSYYELLLQRAPDGKWWVTAIYYPF